MIMNVKMNMSKFRSDQNNLRRDYEKLSILNSRMRAEKERNTDMMRKLESDLRSYKTDANRTVAFRLRKDNELKDRHIKNLENEIENMRSELMHETDEHRKLKLQYQELKVRNDKMKDEYAAIFEQHLRHQQNVAQRKSSKERVFKKNETIASKKNDKIKEEKESDTMNRKLTMESLL